MDHTSTIISPVVGTDVNDRAETTLMVKLWVSLVYPDLDAVIVMSKSPASVGVPYTVLPLTHTQMAKQTGKLGALMFSGTTLNGAYGEWQDLHAPFAPFCAESLMTTDHVRELFNVAEPSTLQFSGIKLLEIHAAADVQHRIEILRNGIHSLNESI